MFCKECGKMVKDTDTVCENCGAVLKEKKEEKKDKKNRKGPVIIGMIAAVIVIGIAAFIGIRSVVNKIVSASEAKKDEISQSGAVLISERQIYSEDNDELVTCYFYDKEGQLICKVKRFFDSMNTYDVEYLNYDEEGRLAEVSSLVYNEKDGVFDCHGAGQYRKLEYNGAGERIREDDYWIRQNEMTTGYVFAYEYDEKDRMIKKTVTADYVTQYTIFKKTVEELQYDEKGRLVYEKILKICDENIPEYDECNIYTYEYDEEDRLVKKTEETESAYGRYIANVFTYTYNQEGMLAGEKCMKLGKELFYTIDYNYAPSYEDSYGNMSLLQPEIVYALAINGMKPELTMPDSE